MVVQKLFIKISCVKFHTNQSINVRENNDSVEGLGLRPSSLVITSLLCKFKDMQIYGLGDSRQNMQTQGLGDRLAGQVSYGGIRRSSASPCPPRTSTTSVAVWPSPRQTPGRPCPYPSNMTQPDATMKRVDAPSSWTRPSDLDRKEYNCVIRKDKISDADSSERQSAARLLRHLSQYMVYASVEECWGENTHLTYTSVNWRVVRDGAITL